MSGNLGLVTLYTIKRKKQKLIGMGTDASISNVEDGDWTGEAACTLVLIF